ncbi:MAG: hypothetical protein ACRDAW_01935 [Metamycoplasmataceae bacterium]
MNKKLLISLGSLSTIFVIAPILTTVSCSSDAPINGEYLIIIPRKDPKILRSDISILRGTDLPAQLIALNKLFGGSGLTEVNQENFKIKVNESRMIVTLTANVGFTFNGKSTLDSNKYTIGQVGEVTNLSITPITGAKLTDAEVTILKGTDINAKWPVLQKLFNGTDFVVANQDKFTVSINEGKLTVTLTAKQGFTINGKQTLSNTFTIDTAPPAVDLNIKPKENVKLSVTQFEQLVSGTDPQKEAVLGLLFHPITADNYKNFTSVVTDFTVTLTAKTGFTFSGNQTLSNTFTVDTPPTESVDLNITPKTNRTLTVTQYENLQTGNDSEKEVVLGLLFHPITADNYKNFTSSVTDFTVTLTAKTGFTFSGSQTLSNTFTVNNPAVNLNITAKGNVTLDGNQILNITSTDAATQLTALQLAFTGADLTQENLTKFTVSINQMTNIITLTAANGFTIGNKNTLNSTPYMVNDVFLGMTVKTRQATFTAEQIAQLKIPNSQGQENAIGYLFDPVRGNYNKITVSVNEAAKTVTITPKQGFVFPSDQLTLTSTPWNNG